VSVSVGGGGKMADDNWISANDPELLASIVRHEGDIEAIYKYIEGGTLKTADGCDFDDCKAKNLWPSYLDTEGLPTVGIGHLITNNEEYDCNVGVTDDIVMQQLADDIEIHLSAAKKLAAERNIQIPGNYVVQRFMVEMCFNIGAGAYSKFNNGLKKLASAVNDDADYSYNDAANEHLDSKWARQVKSRAVEMVDTLRALDT
jgi:GH24 family phage-related lysozyme (muramidase)